MNDIPAPVHRLVGRMRNQQEGFNCKFIYEYSPGVEDCPGFFVGIRPETEFEEFEREQSEENIYHGFCLYEEEDEGKVKCLIKDIQIEEMLNLYNAIGRLISRFNPPSREASAAAKPSDA